MQVRGSNSLLFIFIFFIYPFAPGGCDTRSIIFWIVGIQSFFSLWLVVIPWFKSPICLTLPIVGGRIIWLIAFRSVSTLYEMQTVSSRIWTPVAVSISYDDNHYTSNATIFFLFLFVSSFPFFPFLSVRLVELRMHLQHPLQKDTYIPHWKVDVLGMKLNNIQRDGPMKVWGYTETVA